MWLEFSVQIKHLKMRKLEIIVIFGDWVEVVTPRLHFARRWLESCQNKFRSSELFSLFFRACYLTWNGHHCTWSVGRRTSYYRSVCTRGDCVVDSNEKFEFCRAADDDSTWFMTRTQASTFLPVTSNHQLMIQTAIKSCQRRYQYGTTTAAAMSDINLKTNVWM